MKVLKFDIIYPTDYLNELQAKEKNRIDHMSLHEYVQWIHEQKILYGEVISKSFIEHGWDVMDYYHNDTIYLEKIKKAYPIKVTYWDLLFQHKRIDFYHSSLKDLIASFTQKEKRKKLFEEVFIKRFIKKYCPDIVFLREPCGINNQIFEGLKQKMYIVSLIGCSVPGLKNWRFDFSDLILTLFPPYQNYYISNGTDSKLFEYGTVKLPDYQGKKMHDITFVGVLGTSVQLQKTELLEKVAERFDFKWWGVKGERLESFPNLAKTWQGNASGIKMFQIYQQSKIVLNDYPSNARGSASNIRIKEVFSTGSFLLTRSSNDLESLVENRTLAVFKNDEHCLELVDYYLNNDTEREEIAKNGFEYGAIHCDGAELMKVQISHIENGIQAKKNAKI